MRKSNKPMTKDAASRIQGHADRSGNNQSFKQRAQRAAANNGNAPRGGQKK